MLPGHPKTHPRLEGYLRQFKPPELCRLAPGTGKRRTLDRPSFTISGNLLATEPEPDPGYAHLSGHQLRHLS